MATYKITSDNQYTLEERTLPAATAPRNGIVRRVNDSVDISRIQTNAPGAEWGQTASGWIATKWNNISRVELVSPSPTPEPEPEPTPLPPTETRVTVLITENGVTTVTVDGNEFVRKA